MTETTELQIAAAQLRDEAARTRSLAMMVRATVDLTWTGPGAAAYRDTVAERWAGLVHLAEVQEKLADALRALVLVLEAA